MSELIDQIKADREAGTPGPWGVVTVTTSCGVCHKVGEWPSRGAHKTSSACLYEDYPPTTLERPSEIHTNARRIARVPDMEDALIAQAALIAELVEALQEVRDLIAGDLVGSAWKRACREKIAKANAALARAKEAQK